MKFILGEKMGMTQVFNKDGLADAATIIKTSPQTIIQIKTSEKDGYSAVQIGFGEVKEKNLKKPQKGQFKELGNFRYVKEFRVPESDLSSVKVGDKIDLSVFSEEDKVRISAISKGKGFQGVVKRHGFHGGPRTHGQKHSEREPGSIGGGGRAGGRVVKGMRMAGRMGGVRRTVRNLKIAGLDKAENYIFIKGAVPGRRGSLVEIREIA